MLGAVFQEQWRKTECIFLIRKHGITSWLPLYGLKMLLKPHASHPHTTVSKQDEASSHEVLSCTRGEEKSCPKFPQAYFPQSPGSGFCHRALLSCKEGWGGKHQAFQPLQRGLGLTLMEGGRAVAAGGDNNSVCACAP